MDTTPEAFVCEIPNLSPTLLTPLGLSFVSQILLNLLTDPSLLLASAGGLGAENTMAASNYEIEMMEKARGRASFDSEQLGRIIYGR